MGSFFNSYSNIFQVYSVFVRGKCYDFVKVFDFYFLIDLTPRLINSILLFAGQYLSILFSVDYANYNSGIIAWNSIRFHIEMDFHLM